MSRYGNVPFDLPAGWVWTTIGELVCNRDEERIPVSSAIRKKQANKIYDYYGAAGVIDKVDSYLFDERLLLVGEDGANLISRAKDNAFFAEGKYWVNNHAHILDCTDKEILDFVAFVINTIDLSPYISGSAQPKLNQENLNKIFIPLPPKREQKRIISSVSNLTNVVQGISDSVKVMNCLIDKTRSKILDLAISGKLVPQDPTDEPAVELLKRINPAFKPCDNPHYPFEVPLSWVFASGKDIFQPMKSAKPTGEEFCYIDIDSVDNKNNIITTPKIIRTENAPSRASRFTRKGDVIFSMVRPYLRNISMVQYDNCIASTGFYVCSPTQSLCSDYLFLMMLSDYVVDGLNQYMKGDNSPSINTNNILSWKYPVPPLNEQKRIVAEVQKLYSYLNEIEFLLAT